MARHTLDLLLVDCLSPILAYLGGFSITSLYFCGSPRLNKSLEAAVTQFDLTYRSNSVHKWPALLSRFPRLRYLLLRGSPPSSLSVIRNVDLMNLSPMLEHLELDFANAFVEIFSSRPTGVEGPQFGFFQILPLSTMFPSLKYLYANNGFNDVPHIDNDFFQRLPASLKSLYLGLDVCLTFENLALLPSTLQELDIVMAKSDENKNRKISFPTSLTSLSLDISSTKKPVLNKLPNLTRLLLYTTPDFEKQFVFPSQLQDLRLCGINFTKQVTDVLPPNLTVLGITSTFIETAALANLPKNLIRFLSATMHQISPNDLLSHDLIASLPRTLVEFPPWILSRSRDWHSFPRQLRRLLVRQQTPLNHLHMADLPPHINEIHGIAITSEFILALPKTITFLELVDVAHFDGFFWLSFSFLPNLKRLGISATETQTEFEPLIETTQMLALETFRLCSDHSPRFIELSPTWSNKLTSFTLICWESIRYDGDQSHNDENSEEIENIDFSDSSLDAPSFFSMSDWTSQLPSSLTYLKIFYRPRYDPATNPVWVLPASLIPHLPRSLCECFLNELGPIRDSDLEGFPCVNLQRLDLTTVNANGLTLDGLISYLPHHSLTHLGIKSAPKLYKDTNMHNKLVSVFPRLYYINLGGPAQSEPLRCHDILNSDGEPMLFYKSSKPGWTLRKLKSVF